MYFQIDNQLITIENFQVIHYIKIIRLSEFEIYWPSMWVPAPKTLQSYAKNSEKDLTFSLINKNSIPFSTVAIFSLPRSLIIISVRLFQIYYFFLLWPVRWLRPSWPFWFSWSIKISCNSIKEWMREHWSGVGYAYPLLFVWIMIPPLCLCVAPSV